MNSGADIFSSTHPSGSDSILKERLYPQNDAPIPEPIDYESLSQVDLEALDELRNLAMKGHAPVRATPTLPLDTTGSKELEHRIQAFQRRHTNQMKIYLEQYKQRLQQLENSLYIFNGWDIDTKHHQVPTSNLSIGLLTEDSRQSHGGHFIRWNGKGIALNPGPGFIRHFHQQGFCVRDIDFVVVTHNHPDAYADVRGIYDLCTQLNKNSTEMQIIHYYLQHQAHQQLSIVLKPNSKQAKHTIHCLEMYPDSSDVEKIDLADGISLNYFLSSAQDQHFKTSRQYDGLGGRKFSALGIRLDLSSPDSHLRLGYLSGMSWSPLLAHHLGHCDLLLTAFGDTTVNDYSKLNYNDDCLGYYGCYSLLRDVAPKLMLLTEFGGREGDIRLEVARKIRHDILLEEKHGHKIRSAVLPADINLAIDLKSLEGHCSTTGISVPAGKLSVVASAADFGRLRYLSPALVI